MSDHYADAFDAIAAAWSAGEFGRLDAVMAPELLYHMPPMGDLDLAAYKEYVAGFRQAFPDFRVEADETIVEGERVVYRWHCTATFSGESPVIPASPTGQQTAATGTLVCHFADGRIFEVWHHGDWLSWLTGAGVIPPLG